jgi:hypothetical protein
MLLGPFILSETRNVNRHFTRSDNIFEHLFNCKRFCVFFHKPVPTILCVVIGSVFCDRIINKGVWPPRLLDMDLGNRVLLMGHVTDKVYVLILAGVGI